LAPWRAPARGVSRAIPGDQIHEQVPARYRRHRGTRRDRAGPCRRSRRHPYYNKAPAYAAPIYNWTGFYIGGHIGGAFSGSNSFNGLVLSDYSARLLGGVQAGGDWQFAPNWLVGVEGQYSWLGNNQLNAAFRAASPTATISARSPPSPAASATPGVRAWSTSRRLRLFGQ